MTHDDAGHFARKHGNGAVPDPVIRDTILQRAVKAELSCAVAFEVTEQLGITPEAIGRTADLMELRLVKCQLGLFGYRPKKSIVKPATSVAPALEMAIFEALVNDRLACESAWQIAEEFEIHKMKISAACDALKVKIRPCQLGAF